MRGFSPASCGQASGSDCLSGDTLTLCARSSWSPSLLKLPRDLPATCTCLRQLTPRPRCYISLQKQNQVIACNANDDNLMHNCAHTIQRH